MPLSNALITFVFAGGACLAQSLFDRPTFHADSQRTGWISNETVLTPANVTGGTFGPVWNSPQFDSITIGTTVYKPHLFAAPIYAESATLSAGAFAGKTFSVVFAATTNGFVYAISAFAANGVSPGTTLWKAQLGTASVIPSLDGGLPLGILSTPILDTAQGRLYTASDDATVGWQVYALDITSGNVLPRWPLQINGTTLAAINRNGPTTFQAASASIRCPRPRPKPLQRWTRNFLGSAAPRNAGLPNVCTELADGQATRDFALLKSKLVRRFIRRS